MRTLLSIFLIFLSIQLLTACAGMHRGLKYHNNDEARAVTSQLFIEAAIIRDEFLKVQDCIKKNNAKESTLILQGKMLIHEGMLTIASIERSPESQDVSSETEKCTKRPLERPPRNVANGGLYLPALLTRDFIYTFKGHVLPEVKGTVRSVDYDEAENF